MSRHRIVIFISILLVVGAITAAIYFWRQNAELRAQLTSSPPAGQVAQEVRLLREGDEVPEFTARSTEGREVKVAARGSGNSLLLIFSPSCDRCEAGMPAWIKLNNRLSQLKAPVQVVALSITDSYTTVEHARRIKAPFATVPFPNLELQKKYGAVEVPLTVVVDARGIVQAVWNRPLDEGEVGDVIETVCPECPQRAGL
jgi:peroxiredoxin